MQISPSAVSQCFPLWNTLTGASALLSSYTELRPVPPRSFIGKAVTLLSEDLSAMQFINWKQIKPLLQTVEKKLSCIYRKHQVADHVNHHVGHQYIVEKFWQFGFGELNSKEQRYNWKRNSVKLQIHFLSAVAHWQ